jgi:hypothetical protein
MAIPDRAAVSAPLLERGDRLTRAEFERPYEAMPHLKKAELIEGVVYMPSPARFQQHAEPHSCVITWLGVYVESLLPVWDNSACPTPHRPYRFVTRPTWISRGAFTIYESWEVTSHAPT